MTACGTGLVTESSTIILVPERKGAGKEQPAGCSAKSWGWAETGAHKKSQDFTFRQCDLGGSGGLQGFSSKC